MDVPVDEGVCVDVPVDDGVCVGVPVDEGVLVDVCDGVCDGDVEKLAAARESSAIVESLHAADRARLHPERLLQNA